MGVWGGVGHTRERERDGVQYLSTAIDHLLSMKSVALSNVAGHARAVMSPPNTVSIAPRFINCEAAAAGIQTNNKSQQKGFPVWAIWKNRKEVILSQTPSSVQLRHCYTIHPRVVVINRKENHTRSKPVLYCSADSKYVLCLPPQCIPVCH